ncbi:MAG: hypothetical protein A4E54_01371 [Pelotomaculum sp. PtaB.Bin117]|nr:hypothetical protein [Pelotomaculum terephthalicicum]OPX88206.1 MAG: hypothetical protein A4E54_01371 [Pelotomaculum sp. PtaB.Bin117]OPY60923.1 MAG: hypothetical protein A4E56_02385 [Pelotomaculum sp. PtaU1.Bin065]
MPQVNWAIINVTTGEPIDWIPGVPGGYSLSIHRERLTQTILLKL